MINTEIVHNMVRASDTGDWAQFQALLADECEWVSPVIAASGPEEITRNVAGFFAAFPRRRHDLKLTVESGDNVAIEVRWVDTHESGGHVEVPFAAIMQLRSGLINAVRVYLDTAALMAQLEPAPASA